MFFMCVERDQQLQLLRSKGESAVPKPELQEEELEMTADEPQGDIGVQFQCPCTLKDPSVFTSFRLSSMNSYA